MATHLPIHVSFIWHQHQPSYASTRGPLEMPWVRKHAANAYLDVLRGLKKNPCIKMTFNFSGIFLKQVVECVQALSRGEAPDVDFMLSRKKPNELSAKEIERMKATFFFGNPKTMVDPYPRYKELMRKAKLNEEFSFQDILDLQVLSNLVWIGPFTRSENPDIQSLLDKGGNYSEAEKAQVLDLHVLSLTQLIPALKELWHSGQIEISVTPFYHPILPLLINSDVADWAEFRPTRAFRSPEDARIQVRRVLTFAEELFGMRPTVMWPSEGAISKEAASIIASEGVNAIIACDAVLGKTLGRYPTVSEEYLPSILSWTNGPAHIFFRDSGLSNDIAFKLTDLDAYGAAQQIIRSILGIKGVWDREVPPHITVMVDGENTWESYRDKNFLQELFNALKHYQKQFSSDPGDPLKKFPVLMTTTPSQFLERVSGVSLNRLASIVSGTWADRGSFSTWLGNDLTRTMWEALRVARAEFEDFKKSGGEGEEFQKKIDEAYEHLLAAQGSDFLWWAGPYHDTPQAAHFDAIFRDHLKMVYDLIEKPAPDHLSEPFLNVRRTKLDVNSLIPDHPVITIDPFATRATIPLIGGKRRSLFTDPVRKLASFVQTQRNPAGEKLIHRGREIPAEPITERTDPLGTGSTSVISLSRARRPGSGAKKAAPPKEEKPCEFCDTKNIAGPIVNYKKVTVGRNLFPFLDGHEVLIFKKHIEHMNEIRLPHIVSMFDVLYKRMAVIADKGKFMKLTAGMNFGGKDKPWDAGASVRHWHMQLGANTEDSFIQSDIIADTVDIYRREIGVDIFDYYHIALRRAGLVIWEDNNAVLFAPFAPMFKDQLEIFCKSPSAANFIDADSSTRKSVNLALYLAIRGLTELKVPLNPENPSDLSNLIPAGVESFNMNFSQRNLNDRRVGQRLMLSIKPRSSTLAFAELAGLYVIDRYPEHTAQFMRMAITSSTDTDVIKILKSNPV